MFHNWLNRVLLSRGLMGPEMLKPHSLLSQIANPMPVSVLTHNSSASLASSISVLSLLPFVASEFAYAPSVF